MLLWQSTGLLLLVCGAPTQLSSIMPFVSISLLLANVLFPLYNIISNYNMASELYVNWSLSDLKESRTHSRWVDDLSKCNCAVGFCAVKWTHKTRVDIHITIKLLAWHSQETLTLYTTSKCPLPSLSIGAQKQFWKWKQLVLKTVILQGRIAVETSSSLMPGPVYHPDRQTTPL